MPVNINGTTGINTPGLDSDAMPNSGGDPVVESGSNSDGEWTRWADGTQICRGVGLSLADNAYTDINTPVPFIDSLFFITAFLEGGPTAGSHACFGTAMSESSFRVYLNNGSGARSAQYHLAGRYK